MTFLGPPVRDTGIGVYQVIIIGVDRRRGYHLTNLTAQKARLELTAVREDIWLNESPVVLVAGASRTYTITYEGVAAVTSPSAIAYKDSTDVSGTVFPAGSITASGATVTLKPLTGLLGGEVYVIAITATADGNLDVRKLKVLAVEPSDE
jgi:hypothetical protein